MFVEMFISVKEHFCEYEEILPSAKFLKSYFNEMKFSSFL